MIKFKLWLEAKRKKKAKKRKPAPRASHDMDTWLHELELLSRDLQELQKAKKKFDTNQARKKLLTIPAKEKSVPVSTKKKSTDKK